MTNEGGSRRRPVFALRFSGRERVHNVPQFVAEITARHLVEHLRLSELVISRKPPIHRSTLRSGHGAGAAERSPPQQRRTDARDCAEPGCRRVVNARLIPYNASFRIAMARYRDAVGVAGGSDVTNPRCACDRRHIGTRAVSRKERRSLREAKGATETPRKGWSGQNLGFSQAGSLSA